MKVAIIMGSISDKDIAKKTCDILKKFEIEYDARVISAHRSLDFAIDFVNKMEENKIELIIAFAGKAAHLAGVLAGISTVPVIGVPVKASTLDGLSETKPKSSSVSPVSPANKAAAVLNCSVNGDIDGVVN